MSSYAGSTGVQYREIVPLNAPRRQGPSRVNFGLRRASSSHFVSQCEKTNRAPSAAMLLSVSRNDDCGIQIGESDDQ
jgi:hypothetical protein